MTSCALHVMVNARKVESTIGFRQVVASHKKKEQKRCLRAQVFKECGLRQKINYKMWI